jgi:hypothetical protein
MVWKYRMESLPRKSKVTSWSDGNARCSTRNEQQPTVSASSCNTTDIQLHHNTAQVKFNTTRVCQYTLLQATAVIAAKSSQMLTTTDLILLAAYTQCESVDNPHGSASLTLIVVVALDQLGVMFTDLVCIRKKSEGDTRAAVSVRGAKHSQVALRRARFTHRYIS